ncbi:MAG: M14 family metallopeptidase [Candidatus Cloacimonadaceae bacterium]|nr:M14 family metallopeptidase [Candidatus Cloacimonadaceae bacterium]
MNLVILAIILIGGACAVTAGNIYPLPQAYLKENQLFDELKKIARDNPALVRLHIIGFSSTEQIPLYALEIGRPVSKRKVLIIGQHHGDEVLGVEFALSYAKELAEKATTDKKVSRILDEFHFWILPTINPEGFRIVSEGRYRFKRKTNRDTDNNGKLDLRTDGVDLNRNYPIFWANDVPSLITGPYYKGPNPASEEETRAMINLAQKHRFELAIFYHSSVSGAYSEKIYLAAYDTNVESQQKLYDDTHKFAQAYANRLRRDYRRGHYEVPNGNSSRVGNARNYFFHVHQSKAFLVEIGGINKKGISVIHPPADKMRKIVDMHLKALNKTLYESIESEEKKP